MGNTEKAIAIMHEAGVLVVVAVFVVSGALLLLSYANDGDALPVFGGAGVMVLGSAMLLRAPARLRRWRENYGLDEPDENEAYDEALVRVRD